MITIHLSPSQMTGCFSPQDYLAEAVRFLEQGPDGISVSAIKGIWVASDASDVVNKVRALSSAYFPGVRSEDIVYAGGGVPGGVQTSAMTTHSISQVLVKSRCARGRRFLANGDEIMPWAFARLQRCHAYSGSTHVSD